jgi:hypothetical protein
MSMQLFSMETKAEMLALEKMLDSRIKRNIK